MSIPSWTRKLLFIPPILVGALVLFLAIRNTKPLEKKPPQEETRTLRVIELQEVDVIPRALGYGTAQAAQGWRAVAEVDGRVIEVSAELNAGSFLRQGDIALKIDPNEYQLTVAQLQAEIAEMQAQLAELGTQEANDRVALSIEQASLELAQADLDKVRNLIQQNDASDTELRAQERVYLAQKQKVQSLQKSLELLPRRRASLQASLAVRQTRLQQAELDLAKTIITVPFDCRLGEVDIEVGQYLGRGQVLFEADGAASVEVVAQVAIDRGLHLLRRSDAEPFRGIPDMNELRKRFGIKATVRTRIGDYSTTWDGRFVRVREQVDPVTRTVGIVVAVDEPYAKAIPGERPPLVKNTFCEVEFRGNALPGQLIVPRSALHDGHVYVLNGENRLVRQAVEVLFTQGDFACVKYGLHTGQKVIVSDPKPAIEGMLVDPIADDDLEADLLRQARAEVDLR